MVKLEEIRKRCLLALSAAEKGTNASEISRLRMYNAFLQNERCFVDARRVVTFGILCELGYSNEEACQIISHFTEITGIPGHLFDTKPDGTKESWSAILKPTEESYYRFKNGIVFKKSHSEEGFWWLADGKWILDWNLARMYYDVGYDYEPLAYRCDMVKYLVENIPKLPYPGLPYTMHGLLSHRYDYSHTDPNGIASETSEKLIRFVKEEILLRENREFKDCYLMKR